VSFCRGFRPDHEPERAGGQDETELRAPDAQTRSKVRRGHDGVQPIGECDTVSRQEEVIDEGFCAAGPHLQRSQPHGERPHAQEPADESDGDAVAFPAAGRGARPNGPAPGTGQSRRFTPRYRLEAAAEPAAAQATTGEGWRLLGRTRL
jgi:hypothetical protein